MTTLARLKNHPTRTDCMIIDVPSEMNDAMGTFQPARFDRDHRGFVCLVEHLEAFQRFARFQNLEIVDDRIKKAGHRTWPQECRHCVQPGSLNDPPRKCPACGENWEPITPRDIEHSEPVTTTPCNACGHRQPGRFPFCSNCGYRMTYPQRNIGARLREKMTDPISFGDALQEFAQQHAQKLPVLPPPTAPREPQHVKGRPVDNIELPDNDERPWYDK